jgi:putative peptide zinc metalloprotease protein
VHHGDPVEPGQLLMVLEDQVLVAEHDKLTQQLEGLRTEQFYAVFKNANRAVNIAEKMEKVAAEVQRLEERMTGLQVRSKARGRLVLPHEYDLPNTFVKKGAQLGYVLDATEIKVRVAVSEPDAGLVREQLKSVQVRTADHPEEALVARVSTDTNTVTKELPSPALGDKNGCKYPTDPEDKEGLNTTESVVLMDVTVPATVLERAGVRAAVRFEHGSEPLAGQAYRRLRQLFLRYFATSS